ncbi:MAG TPA: ATP-binding cassette domain-containing protein, partial [Chitinophagaceae bacterium]|nr:ATP-binding cassette domain-containing protein [Chitinophagaceae bacterium]
MHYLSVEGLTRSYGLRVLFDQISFHLSEGDKIALVGRNGSGKTTLMNILAGLDTPDSGTVWVSKDIRVAYLKQSPVLNGSRTVLENIFDHHQPVLDAVRDYEALSALGPSADPATLNASISRVDELNGWDLEARVKQILGRLGIQDFSQPAGELSGGQAKRVAL